MFTCIDLTLTERLIALNYTTHSADYGSFEAAAQSGNAETVENLDKARRRSIVSVDKPSVDLDAPD